MVRWHSPEEIKALRLEAVRRMEDLAAEHGFTHHVCATCFRAKLNPNCNPKFKNHPLHAYWDREPVSAKGCRYLRCRDADDLARHLIRLANQGGEFRGEPVRWEKKDVVDLDGNKQETNVVLVRTDISRDEIPGLGETSELVKTGYVTEKGEYCIEHEGVLHLTGQTVDLG